MTRTWEEVRAERRARYPVDEERVADLREQMIAAERAYRADQPDEYPGF